MAGIMVQHKVRASTLIETITALIIISMVFGFATLIYLNVQRSALSSKKISSQIMIDQIYNNIRFDNEMLPLTEHDFNDLTVYQFANKHPESGSLVVLRYEARDKTGKLLLETKKIVYVPDTRP